MILSGSPATNFAIFNSYRELLYKILHNISIQWVANLEGFIA